MKPHDSGKSEPSRHVPSDGPGRPRYVTHRNGHADTAGPGWRSGGAIPPALASAPDASTLLKALKRRWAVALLLGLIVASGVGVGAWFLLTPKFTVFSQLHVKSLVKNFLEKLQYDRNEFPTYYRAQAERLRSRDVISRAIKQEEVKRLPMISQLQQPIPWIEQELKIDTKEGSEFITVSMRGEDDAALITFVNALVQAYWQEYIKAERAEQGTLVARLEKNLSDTKEQLRQALDRLRQRNTQLNPTQSPGSATITLQLALSDYADAKRKLGEVQGLLLQRQAGLEALKKREASLPQTPLPELEIARAIDDDPQVKQLEADYTKYDRELQDLVAAGVSKREPGYYQREQRVASTKKALDKRRAELRPKLDEQLRQRAQAAVQEQLLQYQADLDALTRQEVPLRLAVTDLAQKVAEAKKDAEITINTASDIKLLEGDIKNLQLLVDNLTNRHEAAKMDLESGPRVTIHQDAAVQYKDNKRQILAAAAAALGALIGVAFCVAWWEFRARRIQTPEEVVTGLGMRVMGSVPLVAQAAVLSSTAELDVHGQTMQEAIDGIRTMLLRDSNMEGTRVVMVTSAMDGEGKTMLASHLAQSLARAGRRTLLVDCDLRRPTAHQLFEQTLQPGFSEVLLREVDESDAIRPTTATEGLFLFPAGQYDREVIQALAKDGLERIFERMRDEYDFVIVDGHPILAAPDSLLIGQFVDAVILSVLRDVSQVPRVYAAHQKLANLGIRVLGSVVTGVHEEEMYGGAMQYALQR